MPRPASAHLRLASLGPRNVAPPCHLAPGPPRRRPRCIQPVADCDRRLTYEPSHLRSSSPRRPAYAQQQVAVLSVLILRQNPAASGPLALQSCAAQALGPARASEPKDERASDIIAEQAT